MFGQAYSMSSWLTKNQKIIHIYVNFYAIFEYLKREIYKNATQKFQYAENAIGSN